MEHLLDLVFEIVILFAFLRIAHVIFADKVVALYSFRFRGCAMAPPLPGQHAFADMNPPVIDQVGFDHPVPGGLVHVGNSHAQRTIAQMPQVQRFVGVGCEVLHHCAATLTQVGRTIGRITADDLITDIAKQ